MVSSSIDKLLSVSVSVIAPTWARKSDPFLHQPYWEMYFATIIERSISERIDLIDVVDLRGNKDISLDSLVDNLEERDIYIYWIFNTADASELYKIANRLRKRLPKSIHIAGGTHVELCQTESATYFDSIVVGPGERSFPCAINDHIKGNRRRIYREDWASVSYSETPYPRRDFLPEDSVINSRLFREYGDLRGTMVYFSRGCIFKCAFCTLNTPSILQTKSAKSIRDEIGYLKRIYNVEAILLKDEIAIHPNEKISTSILEAIGQSNIVWRGQTITRNSYDQLKLAWDSGCTELAVGVETVDENVMRTIGKQWQNKKQIQLFIKNAKEIGIKVKICLILGLPGEPDDIVDQTIKFIEENDIDYANVSGLCPMPGSLMYNDKEKYGIKSVDKEWSNHAHLIHRYSESESDLGLPFEYNLESELSGGRTRDLISRNINDLQTWLRENDKSY